MSTKEEKFVVRLWDGMDGVWIDIGKPCSKDEATKLWNDKTENGTKNTKFGDIDYYSVFPADTKMMYDSSNPMIDRPDDNDDVSADAELPMPTPTSTPKASLLHLISIQANLASKFMGMGLSPEVAQNIAQEALHLFLTSDLVLSEYAELYKSLGDT